MPSQEEAWVHYIGDVEFLLAHVDEVLARKIDNYTNYARRVSASNIGKLDDKTRHRFVDAYAMFVLRDFRGIQNKDGSLYQNTDENKKELLHANAEVRTFVVEEAAKVANFVEETASGNG